MIELNKASLELFVNSVDFHKENIDWEIIVAEIFSMITPIDFNKIDLLKSSIVNPIEKEENITITLISTVNCPEIIFELYNTTLSIYVGHNSGEYLYAQDILEWRDIHLLRNTLIDLFTGNLVEQITYCNDKMIGATFTIPYIKDNIKEIYKFSIHFGVCMFWNRKKIKSVEYDSWHKTNELSLDSQ